MRHSIYQWYRYFIRMRNWTQVISTPMELLIFLITATTCLLILYYGLFGERVYTVSQNQSKALSIFSYYYLIIKETIYSYNLFIIKIVTPFIYIFRICIRNNNISFEINRRWNKEILNELLLLFYGIVCQDKAFISY